MPRVQFFNYVFCVTLFILIALNAQSPALAVDASANQICSSSGALGVRFGDKLSGKQIKADRFIFGGDCYQIKPPITLEYFDTYAVCISEIDGGIYKIQAAKELDTKTEPGVSTLTQEQVESNREIAKKTLDGVLAQLPPDMAERAEIKEKSWKVKIDENISLEVDKVLGWSVGLTCINETIEGKLFKKRIWGK